MSNPTLEQLLEAGAHFGHRTDKWHPSAKSYIYAKRQGVYIIDLEKTVAGLQRAEQFIENLIADGGMLLMVCTKRQGRDIVREAADAVGMPYVVERWLGGTLTNFDNVYKLPAKLAKLESDMQSGALNALTKKERLSVQREIDWLKKIVGGMTKLSRLPSALFVIDAKKNVAAVHEAAKLNIPVVALCDTNVDAHAVAYPIPANDDATKTIALITEQVRAAVQRGLDRRAQTAAPAVTPLVPAAVDVKA